MRLSLLFVAVASAAAFGACSDSGSGSSQFPPDEQVIPPDDQETPGDGGTVETPDEEPPDDSEPGSVTPGPTRPTPISRCSKGMKPTAWAPDGHEINQHGGWHDFTLTACAPDASVAVIPRGQSWTVRARDLPKDAVIRVYTPHYFADEPLGELREPIAESPPADANGSVSFRVTGALGGEHVLVVETKDPQTEGTYQLSATCAEQCQRYTTRYPIVFVHGFLGTENYFGLFDYWNGIPGPLKAAGMEIYTPSSKVVGSPEERAKVVVQRMDDALQATGARRVNLIGHSQGGLDARIIISPNGYNRGDSVASLTTIATPHRGVPIPLLDIASGLIDLIFDFPNFSEAQAKTFNAKYIDAPGTDYYSWSFRTCTSKVIGLLCRIESKNEVVNPLLETFHEVIFASSLGGDNDGLVTVKSAKWGPPEHQFGPVWADHMDQIGQIGRPANGGGEPFNHVTFYQDEARRLIAAGH